MNTETYKLHVKLDAENYIESVACHPFEGFIETQYNMADSGGFGCITDGKHKYADGQIVTAAGSESSLLRHRQLNQQMLRGKRERVCFPIINRGSVWYETLTEAQAQEVRAWYRAWLDATETLTEPAAPAWLK